uniref:Uncharacterized protein n=1 Tax=Rhabditophanes sp. KR3021 TaxID=114890 RepID=A0AC35U5M1_9BILA
MDIGEKMYPMEIVDENPVYDSKMRLAVPSSAAPASSLTIRLPYSLPVQTNPVLNASNSSIEASTLAVNYRLTEPAEGTPIKPHQNQTGNPAQTLNCNISSNFNLANHPPPFVPGPFDLNSLKQQQISAAILASSGYLQSSPNSEPYSEQMSTKKSSFSEPSPHHPTIPFQQIYAAQQVFERFISSNNFVQPTESK